MMHWINPEYLPETTGRVEMFLLNTEGRADGLLLVGGPEVHFPPHLAKDVTAAVQAGSLVTIRGVRPRGTDDFVAAVALEADTGESIIDNGPSKDVDARHKARIDADAQHLPAEIEGVIRRLLHGPKGEIRGVLLEDGRSGRFPSHASDQMTTNLSIGARIILQGKSQTTPLGTVLAIRAYGSAADDLRKIVEKPPKDHRDKHPKPKHQAA